MSESPPSLGEPQEPAPRTGDLPTIAVTLLALIAGLGAIAALSPTDSSIAAHSDNHRPTYDHIVIVIEENKDYDQIIGNQNAKYINETLVGEGALLTQMYAEEHNSQGNYFWLFSGGNQNVGFRDEIPRETTNAAYPFAGACLASELIRVGKTFASYSESMPSVGFAGDQFPGGEQRLYVRKHAPWVSFRNVPASSNLRWDDFPTDYSQLPSVSIVVPNVANDMHDGAATESIPRGSAWLEKNIDGYYQWAKHHNSLLIVTWDENDDQEKYQGLTNPSVTTTQAQATPGSCADPEQKLRHDLRNHIATVFAGEHVKPKYHSGTPVTHVNLLRTLEGMYDLRRCGAQQQNAAGFGIADSYVIGDLFE